MKLNELINERSIVIEKMLKIISDAKKGERAMDEEEGKEYSELEKKQIELDKKIEEVKQLEEELAKLAEAEIAEKNNERKSMEFKELIKRNGDRVENFKVRAITLSSGIYDTKTDGSLSVVGYEPFYKEIGVKTYDNLSSTLKLSSTSPSISGKKGEGEKNDGSGVIATVELTPNRYPLTETIGKEILSIGNEQVLQEFLMEMVKTIDRGITQEVFNIGVAAASGLTASGYTNLGFDSVVGAVDGNSTLLMPRTSFYKAKSVKMDAGSGIMLANKVDNIKGELWDGSPLFYSHIFGTGTTVLCGDFSHMAVATFGDEYEVMIDNTSLFDVGKVKITVVKIADVKVINSQAFKKIVLT